MAVKDSLVRSCFEAEERLLVYQDLAVVRTGGGEIDFGAAHWRKGGREAKVAVSTRMIIANWERSPCALAEPR